MARYASITLGLFFLVIYISHSYLFRPLKSIHSTSFASIQHNSVVLHSFIDDSDINHEIALNSNSRHRLASESTGKPVSVTVDTQRTIQTFLSIISMTIIGSMPVNADSRRKALNPPFERPCLYAIDMTNPPCMIPRTLKGETSFLTRLLASQMILIGLHSFNERDFVFLVRNTLSKKIFTL